MWSWCMTYYAYFIFCKWHSDGTVNNLMVPDVTLLFCNNTIATSRQCVSMQRRDFSIRTCSFHSTRTTALATCRLSRRMRTCRCPRPGSSAPAASSSPSRPGSRGVLLVCDVSATHGTAARDVNHGYSGRHDNARCSTHSKSIKSSTILFVHESNCVISWSQLVTCYRVRVYIYVHHK